MKKALSILFLLALTFACLSESQAQRRKVIYLQTYDAAPYHFGFLLGANFMNFDLNLKEDYQDLNFPKTDLPNNLTGFSYEQLDHFQILGVESCRMTKNVGLSVGVIGDLRLGNYFNLRFSPTLSLSWRSMLYDIKLIDVDGNEISIIDPSNPSVTVTRKIVNMKDNLATYLEFPLHIKYRSKRYNNIGAYLIGGINPKLYLNTIKNGKDYLVPKRADVALEFGAGYDIYNQWFKMGVEIKMSLGMLDLLRDEQSLFYDPLEGLKSKQLQLSFTFE